ncbi:MAG TPA: hypothetical protein VNJ08_09975 [Bacteriovoracaceae bacterium]|nr:hypothetical protein [Bacteriovoracaceae bacterium]
MDNFTKLETLQPRFLRYRSHYRVYLIFLLSIAVLLSALWGFRAFLYSWQEAVQLYPAEMGISLFYYLSLPLCYFFWLKPRINHSVQVFSDRLTIHKGKISDEVMFENIESVTVVGWSLFFLKMKNGHKYYFNSDLERVDYIWEGLHKFSPEMVSAKDYEAFRLSLVQHDHHQKRKEWFFRHKLVDVVNWFIVPAAFLAVGYYVQSREIHINQQSLYFFRLFMYALLIMLITSFVYTVMLKKLIFDRKLEGQDGEQPLDKIRDLEFEGVVIQRSKVFQLITASFLLAMVIKGDINFYSISRTRGDLSYFKIPTGKTVIVDNRFNCFSCRYQLADGDMIMFGKGIIGQILAKEGEPIGEVVQDTVGRTIASLNVQHVPKGHVAVKTANGKDIIFIKIVDLIGKIQK